MSITPSIRRNWLALILFLVITCLAAALRLYRLDALPPGLYHDEAYNGLDALALLHGEPRPLFHEVWEQVTFAGKVDTLPHGRFPLFFVGNYGREPLFYYLLALSLAVAGARPLAIRLVAALTGVLVVPAVYWLAVSVLPSWSSPEPATARSSCSSGRMLWPRGASKPTMYRPRTLRSSSSSWGPPAGPRRSRRTISSSSAELHWRKCLGFE